MNLDDIIDNNLPKGSSNKDLEKRSRAAFQQLLSPEMFEVRSEDIADVGTDFMVELKRNNHYTNFRFAVQLKSTTSTLPNGDGSFSFPVEVNNINYLLNFNGPAFYILYEANTEKFYIKNAHSVFEDLNENYDGRERPEKFTVRFFNELNEAKINEIYDQNMLRGKTLRDTNYYLNARRFDGQPVSRLIIDENETVRSSTDIVHKIVTEGMAMLNEYRYDEIIRLKGMVDPEQVSNAVFHLICGTAHYRKAEMQQASVSFKKARKLDDQLNANLKDLLLYTHEAAKYALGITNTQEFNDHLKAMGGSGYINLFHEINLRFRELYDGQGLTAERIEKFYEQLNQVIAHPEADSNIVLLARAQIIAMEADVLNSNLITNLSAIKSIPFAGSGELAAWQNLMNRYGERAEALRKSALEEKNDFAYNVISINIVRANYSNSLTFHYMVNFDEATLNIKEALPNSDVQMILGYSELIDSIVKKYQNYSSNENMVAALSLQYELFHFIGNIKKAEQVSAVMLELIETYDLKDFERKYKILINGGTRHERFLELLKTAFSGKDKLKAELDDIIKTLIAIDNNDDISDKIPKDHYRIQLIPLGNFSYPKTDFEKVMDILEATSEIRPHFENLSSFTMPVANVFHAPLNDEGPANGNIRAGVVGYRNALKVRKAFRESGYLRMPGSLNGMIPNDR